MAAACAWDLPLQAPPDAAAWVPFRAEFRAVGAGVMSLGRVMRHRDGSMRRETLGPDQAPVFVTIENRATSVFYSFSAGTWTSQALVVHQPAPPVAAEFPNAMPQPARVAGYRVVRADTALGSTMLRAPALNYFALVEEHPYPPLRIEFLSVTEDEPSEAYFAPPPGASVSRLPWPHAIGR